MGMRERIPKACLVFMIAVFIAGPCFALVSGGSDLTHPAEGTRKHEGANRRLLTATISMTRNARESEKYSNVNLRLSKGYKHGEEISTDYGPPDTNPPIHVDPPLPGSPPVFESIQVADLVADYANPGTHPPDVDHDYPPPALMMSRYREKFAADYAPATGSPPDPGHDYPPPAFVRFSTEDFTADYTPARDSPPDVDHDYPPPIGQ